MALAQEVFVVGEDGSPLETFDYHDGLRAEDICECLRNDGYKGNLYRSNRRVTLRAPLLPGATYTFIQEQPRDDAWFLKHDKLPSPSVLANSTSKMVDAFGTDEPVYDMGRTSGSAVPLPLANESFRCYIRNLQSCVRDAVDWSFIHDSMDLSKFFSDERQRQVTFAEHLQRYLISKLRNVTFNVTPLSPPVGSDPDIRVEALIMGEWVLLLLVVVKPEVGLRGEPSVEVMRYYANHFIVKRNVHHWVYLRSCCPVLFVEVVGPTIRVGGAAFFNKPTYEPFTPYLHVYKFLQDNGHLELLSKALASIGVAVSSLVEFYTTLQQQQQSSSNRTRDPTISWPDMIRDAHFEGATVTQYSRPKVQGSQQRQQHRGRENLLLFSLLRPASKRIIKFCQRYGLEVHQKWADLGYAPPFTYKHLDGNWLLVDMEYYTEADGWRCLTALDPGLSDPNATASFNMYRLSVTDWEVCKTAVRSAYVELHSAHPQHVHGDLRRQNILYNVRTSRVAIDWAGGDGSDLYPLFINPTIAWPPGVGSCQPMRCSHDIAVLNMELGLGL